MDCWKATCSVEDGEREQLSTYLDEYLTDVTQGVCHFVVASEQPPNPCF